MKPTITRSLFAVFLTVTTSYHIPLHAAAEHYHVLPKSAAGNHERIHIAAESIELQERLLQNNTPNSSAHHMLGQTNDVRLFNQKLSYAAFTGNLDAVRRALENGASPNNIYKHSSCVNKTIDCLLSYEHLDDDDECCIMLPMLISLSWATPSIALCGASAASPSFCVPNILIPAIIMSFFITKLLYHEYEKVKHSSCWYRKAKCTMNGKTPLIIAIEQAKPRQQQPVYNQMIQLLLQHNADIHQTDKRGDTPLMHAVITKNTGAVELLCLAGSNAYLRNQYGHTPLSKANDKIGEIIKTIHKAKRYIRTITEHVQLNDIANIIFGYSISTQNNDDQPENTKSLEKYIVQLMNPNRSSHQAHPHLPTSPRTPISPLNIQSSAAAIDYDDDKSADPLDYIALAID